MCAPEETPSPFRLAVIPCGGLVLVPLLELFGNERRRGTHRISGVSRTRPGPAVCERQISKDSLGDHMRVCAQESFSGLLLLGSAKIVSRTTSRGQRIFQGHATMAFHTVVQNSALWICWATCQPVEGVRRSRAEHLVAPARCLP